MITDEQKLSLLQMGIKYAETYDEAHDIADFIFGNEQQQIGFSSIGDMLSDAKPQANAKDNVGPAKNGLYIVYGDGAYQIYDELMESFEVRKLQHGGVRGIGIIHYDHSFVVELKDAGFLQLFKTEKNNDDKAAYHLNEASAIFDWDMISNTASILRQNSCITLSEKTFIPSFAQLVLMGYYINDLNDALASVGGEPLITDVRMNPIYLSSSMREPSTVWAMNMCIEALFSMFYDVSSSFHVRPVSAFL